LKNYGLDSISLIDNGIGIKRDDLINIFKRGTTTKKNDIYEEKITEYGFRGEGLFGISALSKEIIVNSKTKHSKHSNKYNTLTKSLQTFTFNYKSGTSIKIKEIFFNNRIRKRDLAENSSKNSH